MNNLNETLVDDIDSLKKGSIKIALLYPNSYYLGMSNLGFQGLLHHFIGHPDFHVNRFFYDAENTHKVFSPENNFSLSQAKIILISQSFEVDFINLVELFLAHGIEPFAEKRINPFIGVGGVFATLNPDFLLSLADIVFRGEFECYIDKLLYFCSTLLKSKKSEKAYLLEDIEKLMGDFIYHKENRFTNKEIPFLDPLNQPNYTHILTPHTSFSNAFLVEITRGCRFRCSFCVVPSLYGKLRFFPKEKLFQTFELGLSKTKKIGFISALTTEHPDLKELIYFVNQKGGTVSFSSLRIEQIDDDFLHLIKENKQNILTIAPEVASSKLKKKIKKPIKIDSIFKLVEKAIHLRFKKFKFYFMIGFEEEDESDLEDIVTLIKKVKEIALARAKEFNYVPNIVLSINQLIPKPNTPLSSNLFLDHKTIKKRVQYLRKRLLPLGNIQIKSDDYRENYLQWLFSHGDNKLSSQIIEWVRANGQYKVLNKSALVHFLSKKLTLKE